MSCCDSGICDQCPCHCDWHVEVDLYTFEVSQLIECIIDRQDELSDDDLDAIRDL